MVIDSGLADIVYTNQISGMPANFLELSLREAGLDPLQLHAMGERANIPAGLKAWKHIWSAGHAVELIHDTQPVVEIVTRLRVEYQTALERCSKINASRVLRGGIQPPNSTA